MLVRTDKKGRPQLVLLDHGLYKQLTEELRLNYAGLWQALIFGDEKVLFFDTLKGLCRGTQLLLAPSSLQDRHSQ